MYAELARKIENKSAGLVVIGLGYVGLPVALLFAKAGFSVTGLDLKRERVDTINSGQSPIEGHEPGLAELLADVVNTDRFHADTDYAACVDAQIILLAVETPVEETSKQPIYQALRSALAALAPHLQAGTMVIVESTIAPGTMQNVVQDELERLSPLRVNQDYFLVHCPERLMPGRLLHNIEKMDRVVGGTTSQAAETAVTFYKNVVRGTLDPTDCLTAELVKTTENAYRDVQIAFANEVAKICEVNGADVWKVRDLVNKSPGRNMHLPGAGVGGHCIPKDPWLLASAAGEGVSLHLIPSARAVNEGMPSHIAEMTVKALEEAGQDPAEACVGVLGYAYLENSDDTRHSPTATMVGELRGSVAEIRIHDPWVNPYRVDLDRMLAGCHALVLMVKHDAYGDVDFSQLKTLMAEPVLVNGRGFFTPKAVSDAGFTYWGIGRGRQQL